MPQKDNLEVSADNTSIYEGGELSPIKAIDLVNNEIAIRQLINEHNLTAINLKNKIDEINNIKSQTEYLKTSPFVSILTLIVNVIGSAILAIAANLMTSKMVQTNLDNKEVNTNFEMWLFIIGIGLIVISSSANILYPYARQWFNK
ncbi:hypothetical protein [Tenuifilum osseticum]|uniref:hypothetical protein n=1 Tax=Tenuifilum osseticum TaxID=3374723 RepID=UPI0034E5D28D